MNFTKERVGKHISTRVMSREMVLELIQAKAQTLSIAERHVIYESKRRGCTLVYQQKGHNVAGPLRERTRFGSRLTKEPPKRVGTFWVVSNGMIRRVIHYKGWDGVRAR